MQTRGLVERQECTSDRRGAFVALTACGREAIGAAAPGHVAHVRSVVFDGLTREQVAALTSVVEHVLGRLDR